MPLETIMGNPEYRFCSLRQDLLATVLMEQPAEGAVFIFPTEISKKECLRQFQKKWQWSATLFLTMEEFKNSCFPSAFPVLKEEKRTLAFYVALTRSMRQSMKIQNYFQCIEPANHFFTLWEECNEELLADPLDFDLLTDRGLETQDWQRNLYQLLWTLKQNYADLIHQHGFEDILFTHRLENLELQSYLEYQRFVWVNQFYYTRLEKELINRLSAAGKHTIVYSQTERGLVRLPQLESAHFSIRDFSESAVQQITIHESKNDFSMMADLMQLLHREPISVIVDNNPSFNAYYRFLTTQKIKLSLNQSFQQTTVYRFLNRLYQLLDVLQPDQQDHRLLLLPLQTLWEAVADQDFFKYFHSQTDLSKESFIEQGLEVLAGVINREYKYIDLQGDFFRSDDLPAQQARMFIEPVLALLVKALAVRDMDDFLQLIDAPQGIMIKDLLNDQERFYSDILDVFYQSLADFSGLKSIGLVHNWQQVFSPEYPSHTTAVSRGWFRLFLEYLKSKRIHFSTVEMPGHRVQVTNLTDTRNLQHQSVAVINAQEGVLPPSPTTPFLFNEHQRKKLGLKSYEQIRLREKYYFSRLTLNTPRVHLFTQKNLEKNVEPSSFVEEFMLYFDPQRIQRTIVTEDRLQAVYRTLMSQPRPEADGRRPVSDDFFIIPFRGEQDYPDRTITLSFYEFQNLAENSFIFYLRHVLHIEPRPVQVTYDFSAQFIGVLAHEVLNTIWHLFIEDDAGLPDQINWPEICERYLDRAFHRFLHDKRCKIPQNHSQTYFQEIYWPVLQAGIRSFFAWLEYRLQIKIEKTRIYPESEFSKSDERQGATLCTLVQQDALWTVKIRGRADLRLETNDDAKKMVFDYKTGAIDGRQLLFYELLYYLINNPALEQSVSSFAYNLIEGHAVEMRQLFKRRAKSIPKQQIIAEFTEQVRTLISGLISQGYRFSGGKKPRAEWQDIIRPDLYQKLNMRAHNANVH